MKNIGNADKQEVGRWANNRVENSHLPFRRRERAMLRFRQMKSLQKFASVHGSLHNHFNQKRHLIDRQTYKARRLAALAEWRIIAIEINAPLRKSHLVRRVRIGLTAPPSGPH